MNTQRSTPDFTSHYRKRGLLKSTRTGAVAGTAKDSAPLPEFTDDALALQFSERYGDDLRYTATWGCWHKWNGSRWERDNTLLTVDLARQLCREASSTCGDDDTKNPMRVVSAQTISAVERLARADRRHAATPDQWDTDPWLLNTPAGTVDLRKGAIRPAVREDYCTKITAVAPDAGDCPLWRSFLNRVTAGDPELQRFLQRVCGYTLTGVTREQALFFLYGTGANGKSVFLNTISALMGAYAKTAPIETFTATTNEHHPTDLAGLRGARLVTAVETEDGRHWAESKLKRMTGGDPIAARFMRQDYFEYVPQFKLLIAGNHKPSFCTVDEAIRRRVHLIPFTVTIPEADRDPQLTEKLHAELGRILQWAIDGCLAWQAEGLNSPAAVVHATKDYLTTEDNIGRWLEECCDVGSQYASTARELFKSWSQWCRQNGEQEGSQKRFSQNLEARGYNRQRSAASRGFLGLAPKEVPEASLLQPAEIMTDVTGV